MTRNPVVSMLAGVVCACFAVLALCVLVMLSGCALDATDTASADELSRMDSKASLERLVEEFESVPEKREEVSRGIVRRGRAFYSEHPGSAYKNLVITMVGDTAADSHLHHSIRAKAVWVLAESAVLSKEAHPRHEAKAQIGRAYAGDSTKVAAEVALSLNKLGFSSLDGVEPQGPELLADGYTTVDSYDPAERGHQEVE